MIRRAPGINPRTLTAGGAFLALTAAAGVAATPAPRPVPSVKVAEPRVDYNRDIRPVLAANCFSCHGQDVGSRQGNLRLDLRDAAISARPGQRAIDPGHPANSGLVKRVWANNALQMPPAASGHTLSQAQKNLLSRWVAQGAPYAEHWSFTPIRRPAVPRLAGLQPSNPIDAFIRARLAREGLKPSPPADRATLIRRVSLDLTGLPPTPEEVDAFLKDASPTAYEKVVDRLLASPRYGEQWARMWLDLARYADTQGYEKDLPRTIWRYRDWVIEAFNADMPYDRFTVEQLAGDLLPNPTPSQILATAFHRNTMTNTEGGTDPEEFRVAAVKDRVDTTVQVWMGLTMGCAKCHTHKYDPITQADYYRFYALFNQTEDANRFDDFPTTPMPTPALQQRLSALDERVATFRAEFLKPVPGQEARQEAWEQKLAGERLWEPNRPESATATSGASLTIRGDGSILASGSRSARDSYTVTLPLPNATIRSLRLEALKDASLPGGGPGREASDQNVVTSEVEVDLIRPDGTRTRLPLTNARADFEQAGWPAKNAIDGNGETGWAFSPRNGRPHVALFDFQQPLGGSDGKLVVTLQQNFAKLQHGCFRLSVSTSDPSRLKPELRTLPEVAAVPRAQRSSADERRLDEAFRQTEEPTATLWKQLTTAEQERTAAEKEVPKIPVLRDLPKERQRVTRVHQRGNFMDPGETVAAAVPATFGKLPAGAPLNRLGAAQWLVSRENPLTARVAVNRFWSRLFGQGLVESEEDFGSQGNPPTHPELLDYLAWTFSAPANGEGAPGHAWSSKKLLRLVVTSQTYRQSAATPAAIPQSALRTPQSKDPRNLFLARGPRFRLPAETVRDQALAVAGLLSPKLGGPSVMPPQPDGIWRTVCSGLKWQTSAGEDRYRRALYTFWRRSSPYPALTTFDAASGEFCVIKRIRTNTPLQALVTLNDPAFVEAAGKLGLRMHTEGPATPQGRIAWAFQRVLTRQPAPAELTRLTRLYTSTLTDFRTRPEAAKELLKAANVTLPEGRNVAEVAAGTVLANVLLNLDETLTRP